MVDKTISFRLLVNDQEFAGKMRRAGKGAETAFDGLNKKSGKALSAIDGLSTGVGLMGAAMVGGAGLAVKSFANFDKAMSSVKATGDDARGSFDQLRAAAIKAGKDTAFSATDAAGGVENLLKAGVAAKDVLGGGLSGALDLAAAGGLDVADAAETAATAMTQFKLSGKDVPHIADLLAAGAGKAQGEVSDMAQALKQSGLVASQFGLSIEDTTGTLAAFASAGLIGSDAGTSFKTMLLALANPAKETREKMDELGIAAYDAQGNFVGITNLAQQLHDKLGPLEQSTRDAALAQIFGTDAIRAANVLYQQGAKGIQEWITKVDDAGFAAETASTKMDNLAGDWEAFTGSIETALIGAGNGANGPLRDLVQKATDAVNAFSNLPPEVQQTTTAIVGGGGLVLLGVAGIGKLVTSVADVKSSLKDMGVTAKGVGTALKFAGAAVAVTGVAIALGELTDNMSGLGASSSEVERNFRDFQETGKATGALAKLVGENFEKLGRDARDALDPSVKKQVDDFVIGWSPLTSELEKVQGRFKKLDETLAGMEPEMAADTFALLTQKLGEQGIKVDQVNKLFPVYLDTLRVAKTEQDKVAQSSKDAAASVGQVGGAVDDVVLPTQTYADKLKAAADEAKGLTEQADLLYDSLRLLDTENISAEESAIAFRDQIRGMAGDVKGLKEEYGKHGTTLKANTAAGDANRTMLLNGIQAAERAAKAQYDKTLKTKGEEAALKSANATMNANIQTLRKEAERLGLNGKDVDKYIAKQLGIPVKQITKFTAPGLKDAIDNTKKLKEEADKLKDKTATFKMKLDPSGVPVAVFNYKGRSTSGKNRRQDERSLAAGGLQRGPGTGTSDDIPAWLSNGEFVMPAKATAQNLAALEAARSGAALMAIPGMRKGGIVNSDAVKLKWSTPGMQDAIAQSNAFGNAYGALGTQVAGQLLGYAKEAVESSFAYTDVGGSGVQRWRPMVLRALGIVGQPASYAGITLRRMNQESGGNATIVNRTDSNWVRGTPSVGLMQVIGPTYRAYRHPSYDTGPYSFGTSVNPLSNTLASMRYALSRYGSLPSAYNRKGGYDSGGWLMPGTTLAYNGTGVPERVFSPRESAAASGVTNYYDVHVDAPHVTDRQGLVNMIVTGLVEAQAAGRTRVKVV